MIKIHKYGGQILKDENSFQVILKNILEELKRKHKIVIIISAIGRNSDPYATDTLLKKANNLSKQERDRLITIGETLASLFLLDFLKGQAISAYTLNKQELGIKIYDNHFDLNGSFYESLLKKYDVLIAPGFQGEDRDGNICSMPRGGSDISAILIAKMLKVNEVSLYKDVKGVMSGDPRLVASPNLIKYIDYNQCYLLSSYGGKIIQKEAVQLAKSYGIKILVKDFYTSKVGTSITNKSLNSEYICITTIDSYIYMLGNNIQTTKEEINELLKAFHIKIKGYRKNKNSIKVKVDDGKRNFALNLLHHKYIA